MSAPGVRPEGTIPILRNQTLSVPKPHAISYEVAAGPTRESQQPDPCTERWLVGLPKTRQVYPLTAAEAAAPPNFSALCQFLPSPFRAGANIDA